MHSGNNKRDKGLFRNHCMSGYGNLCDSLLQIFDRMEFSSGHSIRMMVSTTLWSKAAMCSVSVDARLLSCLDLLEISSRIFTKSLPYSATFVGLRIGVT